MNTERQLRPIAGVTSDEAGIEPALSPRVSPRSRTETSGFSGQRADHLRERDMDGDEGFEPSLRGSEPRVLPLDESPVSCGSTGDPRRHRQLFSCHARLHSELRWVKKESNLPGHEKAAAVLPGAALDLVRLRAVSPRLEGLLRASG